LHTEQIPLAKQRRRYHANVRSRVPHARSHTYAPKVGLLVASAGRPPLPPISSRLSRKKAIWQRGHNSKFGIWQFAGRYLQTLRGKVGMARLAGEKGLFSHLQERIWMLSLPSREDEVVTRPFFIARVPAIDQIVHAEPD